MDFYGRRERVVIKFEGAPPTCSCKIGERVCARMGGLGQAQFGSASGISARASGLRMSVAVLLQYRSLVAEATPRRHY